MAWLLRGAARIYHAFLLVYPAGFRRDWGRPMAEAFRDGSRDAARRGPGALARFWAHAASDLASSALTERWATVTGGGAMGRMGVESELLRALGAGTFGWLCLHTDETGILACSVMLLACGLGLAQPRRAGLAALLLGLAAPGAQILGHVFGWHVPAPNGPVPDPADWADVAGACLAPHCSTVGATAGACGGWALAQRRRLWA